MLKVTVEHKYCKCTKVIEGDTIAIAFKHSNTDSNIWLVIDIEEI